MDVNAKCKGLGNAGSESPRARGHSFPAQPAGWEVGLENLARSATEEGDSEVELDSFISPRVGTRDPKSSPGSSTGCGQGSQVRDGPRAFPMGNHQSAPALGNGL